MIFGIIGCLKPIFSIENVVLQKGETSDARWVSRDELMKIDEEGKFFNHDYLKEIHKIGV